MIQDPLRILEDFLLPALNIVIIGSGIAGLSAAQAARETAPDCRVTILSEDSHPPYYRQRLCEVLEDPARAAQLYLHPLSWYQERGLDLRLNQRVSRLDTREKTVHLTGGGALRYDRLILASGSQSLVPPIKGALLPGVETLWTMEDARRIEARIDSANGAIIIGGGLLGLEAAYTLHKRGLRSLILERLPRLMMRQLDERAAGLFTAQVEKEGTHVTTDAFIDEITSDEHGRASGVRLRDGSLHKADLIIISAGVRARLEYLEGSGIAAERHVLVDARMRTNVKDVYAAGDCAMFDRRWYGLWPIAKQQGATAGQNAAGGQAEYEMPVPPYLLKTMGTQIASAGLVEESGLPPEELEQLHREIMENSELYQYAKKLYVGDTLSGFILLGDTKAFSSLNRQLKQ